MARREFHIDHRTLRQKLADEGIRAGEDQKYSTRDICVAIFGDLHQSKIDALKIKCERELTELRGLKVELVERKPWEQYMRALVKVLYSAIERLPMEHFSFCAGELERVLREFAYQYPMLKLATIAEKDELKDE